VERREPRASRGAASLISAARSAPTFEELHGAHELRVAVEERASDSEVRAAFDRVRRSYHAVRDEVAHSDSRVPRRDFGPVTDSYRAVEHELGVYPGRDEYLPPA
jgi:hypothetical protein